jgi:hypothetical protein
MMMHAMKIAYPIPSMIAERISAPPIELAIQPSLGGDALRSTGKVCNTTSCQRDI